MTTDASVRIGAFWITANTTVWTGRERNQVFFLMSMSDIHRRQEKKNQLRPLPFCAIVFEAIWKATICRQPSSINQGKFRCTMDIGIQVFDPVRQLTGEKPERRRPLSIKTSPYWWTTDADLKIVPFRIAGNMMVWNGRGQIQLFFFLTRRQMLKSWIRPFPFRAIVFVAIWKVTIHRGPSPINNGKFWWTTDAGVQVFHPVHQWPYLGLTDQVLLTSVAIPRSHRLGFFLVQN